MQCGLRSQNHHTPGVFSFNSMSSSHGRSLWQLFWKVALLFLCSYKVIIALIVCISFRDLQNKTHASIKVAKLDSLTKKLLDLQFLYNDDNVICNTNHSLLCNCSFCRDTMLLATNNNNLWGEGLLDDAKTIQTIEQYLISSVSFLIATSHVGSLVINIMIKAKLFSLNDVLGQV